MDRPVLLQIDHMDARQALVSILSVPAVYLLCFALLGASNTMLRIVLEDVVLAYPRVVGRWGLFGTLGRMFAHDVRTGQDRYTFYTVALVQPVVLGSGFVSLALVVALAPTGTPPQVVGACAVVGTVLFTLGLARHAKTLGNSPNFLQPASTARLSAHGVDHRSIGRNVLAVLLYRRWDTTAFSTLALTMLFAGTRLLTLVAFNPPAEHDDPVLALAGSLLVAGPAVAVALSFLVGSVIDHLWAGAAAQDAIQSRLAPRARADTRSRRPQAGQQMFDRFAEDRRELTLIVTRLGRAADRLDSGSTDPSIPHPSGVLLRACAARVRAHLSSLVSLTAPTPRSLDALLAEASVLFFGPPHPAYHEDLDRLTGAFGPDGAPLPQFTRGGRNNVWTVAGRAADAVEKSHKLLTGSIGIVSIIILTYLVLTGRLDGGALLKS